MNEEKSSFIKGINEQHPAAYHQLYNEYYKGSMNKTDLRKGMTAKKNAALF